MSTNVTTNEAGLIVAPCGVEAFPVGAKVEIYAMGSWYAGEVVAQGASRVTVRYTSGAGVTRDKAVSTKNLVKVLAQGRSARRTARQERAHERALRKDFDAAMAEKASRWTDALMIRFPKASA